MTPSPEMKMKFVSIIWIGMHSLIGFILKLVLRFIAFIAKYYFQICLALIIISFFILLKIPMHSLYTCDSFSFHIMSFNKMFSFLVNHLFYRPIGIIWLFLIFKISGNMLFIIPIITFVHYLFNIWMIYKLLEKMGMNKFVLLMTIAIFSFFPSHESNIFMSDNAHHLL